MNEAKPLAVSAWRMAALPLVASAGMLLLAVAVLVVSTLMTDRTRTAFQASTARLLASQEALQASQVARAKLEVNLSKFVELKAGKFVGVPDRLALLEAVERAASLWPKGLLQWEIQPQKTVRTVNEETSGSPLAEVRVIPMRLSATNVHEAEWIEFLEALERQRVGYFRVGTCGFKRSALLFQQASVPAVNATCLVSWVFVVPQVSAAAVK